ncbi:MAG: glycosyltransferase family 2 protein [Gaiellaceae bacterium]
MERPRVAVAIVNANSGRFLRRSLAALAEQTRAPDRILVVDNGSTDGSADGVEAEFPSVEVIRLDANVGFAAANNLAAREAGDSEWLALLNPDAFPEARWLEELLRAAEAAPGSASFSSRIVMDSDPGRLDAAGDVMHVSGVAWQGGRGESSSSAAAPREVFSASAAAALYRRDAFLAVGGFDERFFCYYEDVDLGFRLRLVGHRSMYVPGAVARHVGSSAACRDSDFMLYHTHRNIVWTYVKDMPSALFWLYLPQHLLVNLATLAAFAITRRAGVAFRAKRDALRGLPEILRERRAVQDRRVVSSREIRRALARGRSVVPVLSRRSRELAATAPTEPAGPPPSRPA